MAGSVEILIKYYRIRHTLRLYNELSATEAKILIQLRSGHANLCKYFHRTKKEDSARCVCGHPKESVRYFLIGSPRWIEQRRIMNRTVKEHSLIFLICLVAENHRLIAMVKCSMIRKRNGIQTWKW